MSEPLKVPVSPFQRRRLESFAADFQLLEIRRSEYLTGIIAGTVDPDTVRAWKIDLGDDGLTMTPVE